MQNNQQLQAEWTIESRFAQSKVPTCCPISNGGLCWGYREHRPPKFCSPPKLIMGNWSQ